MREGEGGFEINRQQATPLGPVRLGEEGMLISPHIVHQDIERTGLGEPSRNCGVVGHIDRFKSRADFAGQNRAAGGVAVAKRDGHAVACEMTANGGADAIGATGHQGAAYRLHESGSGKQGGPLFKHGGEPLARIGGG
jgi:hypothetical protein